MRIEVGRFTGHDWEGPATWAQQARWDSLHRQDTTGWYRDCVAVWPVTESLPDVLARISQAVSRYEGLRTQVLAGPVQRLYGTGDYPVEIVEAGARHDFVVAEVSDRLRAADRFEPGRLPFDFAVVTEQGVPRSLVLCLSHLAMDAATIRVLLDHGFAPPADVRPRDMLELQDGFRRRSDKAVAYWRGELAKVDLPLSTRLDSPGGAYAAGLSSVANADRLTKLSSGLSSSAVVLGVVAVALQSVSQGSLCLQLEMSNRHIPGLAQYIGVLTQSTPLVVDVDRSLTFGDLVRQMQQRSLKSFRNAMWSPPDLYEGLAADGLSPDAIGATYSVNDVRDSGPRIEPRDPDPGRDYALYDLPGWPYQLGRCSIVFAGGAHTLAMAVRVDTAYVPASDVTRILIAMDSVLRNAGPDVRVAELIDAAEPAAV